tara:strand:+ start:187 stop:306 length:120 start_codon:yes stop_codon:yes gene_type:complete
MNKKIALIFGITAQDISYLDDFLLKKAQCSCSKKKIIFI